MYAKTCLQPGRIINRYGSQHGPGREGYYGAIVPATKTRRLLRTINDSNGITRVRGDFPGGKRAVAYQTAPFVREQNSA